MFISIRDERLFMGQAPDSLQDSSNASDAPRIIDRFRAAIRSRHYSLRTEKTCTIENDGRAVDPVCSLPPAGEAPALQPRIHRLGNHVGIGFEGSDERERRFITS